VTYHNSWVYFAERFGLKIDLFLEPKPGIPPTPANLAHVKAVMKEEHIGVIIVEPYLDRKRQRRWPRTQAPRSWMWHSFPEESKARRAVTSS